MVCQYYLLQLFLHPHSLHSSWTSPSAILKDNIVKREFKNIILDDFFLLNSGAVSHYIQKYAWQSIYIDPDGITISKCQTTCLRLQNDKCAEQMFDKNWVCLHLSSLDKRSSSIVVWVMSRHPFVWHLKAKVYEHQFQGLKGINMRPLLYIRNAISKFRCIYNKTDEQHKI